MTRTLATAVLPLLALAMPALADPPANFDTRVEAIRAASETPGMAVAIVENGQVVLAKGYGVRKIGSPSKVDADTLFMIGSTGKAFTTAALATLVDAGKIGWDDKVIDHLPGFEMYDPWVSREMTVRDLLVHRSGLGLGAGDLLMVPRGKVSRAEIVRRLRYIKPATSFRSAMPMTTSSTPSRARWSRRLADSRGKTICAITSSSPQDFQTPPPISPYS